MNRVIDIAKYLQMLCIALLLLFAVEANGQAPSPRGLNDDQVQRMLDNERWTFGRKNMRSNRKNRNGSGNNNGEGASSGSGPSSGGGTRSDRTTNGDGEYYWDDRETTDGQGDGNNNVDPGNMRDREGDDGFEERPDREEQFTPPPQRESRPPKPPAQPTDTSGIIGALKYIVIGLAIVLLVYLILQVKWKGAVKGKKVKVQSESEYVDFEDNIHEIEFVDEIELAVRAGDFRKAIRLRFLNVLKDLSDVSLIRWKINKTNYDYIGELRGYEIQKGFMKLTTVYEYCWYGDINISKGLYQEVAEEFNQFNNELNEVAKR